MLLCWWQPRIYVRVIKLLIRGRVEQIICAEVILGIEAINLPYLSEYVGVVLFNCIVTIYFMFMHVKHLIITRYYIDCHLLVGGSSNVCHKGTVMNYASAFVIYQNVKLNRRCLRSIFDIAYRHFISFRYFYIN